MEYVIWREDGYDNFKIRLDKIFSLSNEDYINQLDQNYRYVCDQGNNDETLNKIDDIIMKFAK